MGGRRNKDMIVGGDKTANQFSAPVSLFVANVRQDIECGAIQEYLAGKGLNIVGMEKVSHKEARNASFRVDVRVEDKEKALNGETWPTGVRVREYRHFRQRKEQSDQAGQFNV